jgi:uncharacterized protein
MTQQQPLPGRFIWRDLMTTEPETAKKFYTELLGWTSTEQDMGPMGMYTMLHAAGKGIGGIVPLDPAHGVPSHWIGYVTVPDVDAAVARAEELGGKACVPATDIPEVGRFAVVEDPKGAVLSPFRALREEAEGRAEPGQFCWDELLTPDPEAVGGFYTGLFGWTLETHDMGPMGTYWLVRRGGKDIAGLMPAPEGSETRPYWLPYVLVEDVDATASRVEELGGKLCKAPSDIPGIGRFAVAADPTGGVFALYKDAGGHE